MRPIRIQYLGEDSAGRRRWLVNFVGLGNQLRAASLSVKRRIARILQEMLRQFSPKLTGKLSKSWRAAVLGPRARIWSAVVYCAWQNYETKNKGYVRRAMRAALPLVEKALANEPQDIEIVRPGAIPVPRRPA